jgi:hypothetical protein
MVSYRACKYPADFHDEGVANDRSRRKRVGKQLEDSAYFDKHEKLTVRIDTIVHQHPSGNTDHTVFEIHDILHSYYNVARKRFVDNVRMHVVDFFLITGSDTPLSFFSPSFVTALSQEELEEIAGEDSAVRRRRAFLTRTIDKLLEGKKILS